MFRSVVCLAGGVGAARFLDGLAQVYPPEKITAIVNTGDDLDYLGVHISPDLDIVTYTLAGIVDTEKGYGIAGDTYNCMAQLERYSAETWFRIGDRDFATHLLRTAFLQQGFSQSELTEKIRMFLWVKIHKGSTGSDHASLGVGSLSPRSCPALQRTPERLRYR